MYILKNAYLNIIRSKGRNLLIGLIITIVVISAFISITISKSGENLVESYKQNNPLKVTLNLDMMNFRNADENAKNDFELLSIEDINNIGKLSSVNGYYYTLESSLNSDDIEKIDYEDMFSNKNDSSQPPETERRKEMNTGDFTVIAYSDSSYNEDFIKGNKKIVEGEMLSPDDTSYKIVISEELADENDINIGDKIEFKNTNDESITYTLEVSGIYSIENETSDNMGSRMMPNSTNQIYSNLTVLNKIIDDDGTSEDNFKVMQNVTAAYYVDYENIDKFEEEVKNLGISDYYKVMTNEEEVTSTLNPIKNISSFSKTFLIITFVVGITILTIINLFNIRERKYEIGVLRAIGMTKLKITLQLVTETVMITIISLIVGITSGTLLAQPVTNYMLKNEIENYETEATNMEENFGSKEFGMMRGPKNKPNDMNNNISYVDELKAEIDSNIIITLSFATIVLTALSSSVAVLYINKYEPNKILQNRE